MYPKPLYICSWNSSLLEEQLYGYAYLGFDAIIQGSAGLKKYKNEQALAYLNPDEFGEGRFLVVLETPDSGFVCRTDDFGQETLFLYRSGDEWAISNSFMFLVEEVRASGRNMTVRSDVLKTFLIANQSLFGGQLMSHDTPIDEIKLVPIDEEVVLERGGFGEQPSMSCVTRVAKRDEYQIDESNYRDHLAKYVSLWGGRFRSLSDSGVEHMEFDLSGGYDTRLCLSLILASGNSDRFSYFTNKNIPEDYAIVKILVDKYSLKHATRTVDLSTVSEKESYDIWRWGSAGIYAPIRTPKSVFQSFQSYKVTGAYFRGRDFESKPYNKFVNVFKNGLTNEEFEQVFSLYRQGLNALGVEEMDPRARALHYKEFRARIHYGRSWAANFNEVIVTPKMSKLYEALEAFRKESLALNEWEEQVPADIYSAVDKELLTIPFDKPEKSISQKGLLECKHLGLIGGNLLFGKPPKVYSDRGSSKAFVCPELDDQSFARLMVEKFYEASENHRVIELFGRAYVERARGDLIDREFKHNRVYHQLGKISAIVAASELMSY